MILFPTVDEDYQYFVSQGYSGSINDMHYQALGVLGYTGSYTDRLYAYLVATYGSYHQALYDLRTGVSTFALGDAYTVANLNPDLVFDFATDFYRTGGSTSTFDNSLTYTGASAKTMVDSDGLVKWAPHNLQVYSQEFDNAAWGKTGSTITANAATAPNGTVTADKLVEDTGTSSHYVVRAVACTGVYTLSVYAKAVERDSINIWSDSTSYGIAYFDLTTGVVTSVTTGSQVASAAILDMGDGWYRCSVTTPPLYKTVYWVIGLGATASYTGDGTSGAYVWGAHLYRSDLGGMVDNPDRGDSYVPTTSAAVYLPRRGHHIYNGSTWVNEGILLESEARTNLCTESDDLSTTWIQTATNRSQLGTAGTGPDGVASSAQLVEVGSAIGANIRGYLFGLSSTAAAHTYSVWLKDATGGTGWVTLVSYEASDALRYTYFNISAGTIGTVDANHTATIENYGGGWYRCAITFTFPATTTQRFYLVMAEADADSTVDVATYPQGTAWFYHYGSQMEIGSTASSLLPTAGATVTRAAETLTVAAANLPYSATNMSMQMDGELTYADTGDAEAVFYDYRLNSANYVTTNIRTQTTATGEIYAIQASGGTADDVDGRSSQYTPGVNVPYNLAVRHGATFINAAVDGTTLTADLTPTSLPDLSATNMLLAYDYMGTIGKFRMWDVDLGDTGIASASDRTYTNEFAMIVATTGAPETFTIPCRDVGTFNAGIDWGDGQVSTITAYDDAALTHTYAAAGDHVIRITGTFPNIYFNETGDRTKVKSVENLGEVGWISLSHAFERCTAMTSFTAGRTDTSAVTDMSFMLESCTALTSVDVSSFNTTSCTVMALMFYNCNSLTSLDLSSFDTTLVTSMAQMFLANTSLVTLDISSFNTAAVHDLSYMFHNCTSLTPLSVSHFVTTAATNMKNMFYNCTSLTDIIGVDTFDIGGLNSTKDLTEFALGVTLPTARYDALLLAWEAQDPFNGMAPNFGSSTYTGGGAVATARASFISRDGWTITDGGVA